LAHPQHLDLGPETRLFSAMQSTPAIFCTPAMHTPCVSTPSILKQGSLPWAVKTPEASPMCWGVAPGACQVPAPPLVSKELLRKVCEPFFEQMLTALQDALQEQMLPQESAPHADTQVNSDMYAYHGRTQFWTPLDLTLEEASTEAEDCGAFASLLSGSCSEEDTTPNMDMKAHLLLESALPEESDQTSDSEKSAMVCRHWKTKGWCRMESNCKFLHPEHKRGIAAPKGCISGSNTDCDMSKAACPGMSTTSGLPADAPSAVTVPARRKRGGRNRSKKGNNAELLGLSEAVVAGLPGHMEEQYALSALYAPFV